MENSEQVQENSTLQENSTSNNTSTTSNINSLTGQFTSLTNNLQNIATNAIYRATDVANVVQNQLDTTVKDAYKTSKAQLVDTGYQLKNTVEKTIQKVEDEFTGVDAESLPSLETNIFRVQGEGLPDLKISSKPRFQTANRSYDKGDVEPFMQDTNFDIDSMHRYFKSGSFR